MSSQDSQPSDEHGVFATTHWSQVLAVRRGGHPSTGALESLCRTYWYPLYAFVRCQGFGSHDAQDLTQEFFARLLRKNSIAEADPNKGRFRSYLLGAMQHFLSDEWDKLRAEKRGGGREIISFDSLDPEARYALEPAGLDSPEQFFDRRWGLTVLDGALQGLRQEFSDAGKARQFDLLKPFLTQNAGPGGYDDVALALEMTANAVSVSVHRLRQRYRERVRAVVAQTVATPAEVDAELRALFS